MEERVTEKSEKMKTPWEKEKMLFTSYFSLSYSIFMRLILQACKSRGLFQKGFNSTLNDNDNYLVLRNKATGPSYKNNIHGETNTIHSA